MAIRRPWTWLATAGALGAAGLAFVWPAWSPALPPCVLHEMTGLHCPGCGGTRGAGHLLRGDVAAALSMNAAVVLIAFAAAAVAAAGVWNEWRGRPYRGVPPWLAWTLGGLVLIFGLVRNLPWWPFTLLAPI